MIDILDDLIQGGFAELKKERKRKAEISAMSPEQKRAITDRLVVNLVQRDEVLLQVERCHCLTCHAVHTMPLGVMLYFEDIKRKLRVWKRATPESSIPQNPQKGLRFIDTEVTVCQNCWGGDVNLKAIAAAQPADTPPPPKPKVKEAPVPAEVQKELDELLGE